jgi:hypothetical protein
MKRHRFSLRRQPLETGALSSMWFERNRLKSFVREDFVLRNTFGADTAGCCVLSYVSESPLRSQK